MKFDLQNFNLHITPNNDITWEEVTCVRSIGEDTSHIIEFVTPKNDFGVFNKFQTPIHFEIDIFPDGKVITIEYDLSQTTEPKHEIMLSLCKVFNIDLLLNDTYLLTLTNQYFYKNGVYTE